MKREERVILAWIRDVTAEKQARLRVIREELRGSDQESAAKACSRESGVAR